MVKHTPEGAVEPSGLVADNGPERPEHRLQQLIGLDENTRSLADILVSTICEITCCTDNTIAPGEARPGAFAWGKECTLSIGRRGTRL
jgi:hypothetical protein